MTTLYLVRHGETVDNARQIMQGQTQGELSEKGIRQARKLAEHLKAETIDTFIASDLKRAVDTCTILATPHGKQVCTTPLLRERDWGDFTGCYIPDIQGAVWPQNVESLDHLQERARQFIAYIKQAYPDQCVLAVGHGIINKAIQAVHYGKPMQQVAKMDNCEVRVLQLA